MNEERASVAILEPDPLYRGVFERIFFSSQYTVRYLDTAVRPPLILPSDQILLMDINQGDQTAFDLLVGIREQHTTIPVIVFCDEDIGESLDHLASFERVNVMDRLFTREELLFFIDKLLHAEHVFGLKHYLKRGSTVREFPLRATSEVRDLIEASLAMASEWGFDFDYDFKIDLVLHELFLNAIYHAYGYEEEKKQGIPVTLPSDESIRIEVGHDENRFGIAITDFKGNLSRARILDSLRILEQQKSVERLLAEGRSISDIFRQHGRGIDIVRKNSGEYYFAIERGKRTQVVIIFDKHFERDDQHSSIKVIEFGDHASQ
jgi:anti-sigma regulatory factor (Ser/Thr protein kinase)